jgi:hypothetical protein
MVIYCPEEDEKRENGYHVITDNELNGYYCGVQENEIVSVFYNGLKN